MFGYSLDLLFKMSMYIRAYIFVMVEPSPWTLNNLSFLGTLYSIDFRVRKFVMEL
jgi:hypothetical protein